MLFVLQRSATSAVGGHGLTRSKCAGSILTKCGRNFGGPFSCANSNAFVGVLGSVKKANMSSYTGTESGILFRQVSAGDFTIHYGFLASSSLETVIVVRDAEHGAQLTFDSYGYFRFLQ